MRDMSKHVRAPLAAATTARLENLSPTGFVCAYLEIATLASLPDVDTVHLCFRLLVGTALASRMQRVRFANRTRNARASGFRGYCLPQVALTLVRSGEQPCAGAFVCCPSMVSLERALVGQPLAAERQQFASSGQRFVVFNVGRSM